MAAAADGRAAAAPGSGDDARKWMAGGAKVGTGWRLVTLGELKQRLHIPRQRESGPVHGGVVNAQLGAHAVEARLGGDFVDAGRIYLLGTDYPTPEHGRVDRHVAQVRLDDRKRALECAHRGEPLAGLRHG